MWIAILWNNLLKFVDVIAVKISLETRTHTTITDRTAVDRGLAWFNPQQWGRSQWTGNPCSQPYLSRSKDGLVSHSLEGRSPKISPIDSRRIYISHFLRIPMTVNRLYQVFTTAVGMLQTQAFGEGYRAFDPLPPQAISKMGGESLNMS